MAATITQVLMIAPELSSESNERIQYFLDESLAYINATYWGSKANHAQALLTAHFLTKSPAGGGGGGSLGAGPVTRKKVGDIEVSYAAPASNSGSGGVGFGTTSYGEQFEALKRTLATSPFMVIV